MMVSEAMDSGESSNFAKFPLNLFSCQECVSPLIHLKNGILKFHVNYVSQEHIYEVNIVLGSACI